MTAVDTVTGEILELDRAAAERRAERIRFRLDAIADNYTAVMPMIRESIEKRDDLALGYASVGAYVADRFGGALQQLGVEVRREVVRELTVAGMSTRAIAPVVGVNNATVHRDLSRVASATPQTPVASAAGASPAEPETTTKVAPSEEGAAARAHVAPTVDDTAATPQAGVTARPAVVGLDGKTYSRTAPTLAQQAATAVREFPDLAFYAERGDHADVVNMAGDLRRFRDRGELDERLDTLRRSIAVARAKRDGTYRPGTTAVMGADGEYRMEPMAPVPSTRPCPTCNGRGVVKES